jgi:hypothetical protein
MADTKTRATRRPSRLRRPAVIWGGVAVVMIGTGATLAWRPWSHGGGDKVFETSMAQITYEVDGSGTSPRIEYVNGPDNQTLTAKAVKLPWRTTLSIPVGLAGAVADMTAAYPDSGQPLTCRILIGDKMVRQTQSSDGYSAAACSTVVPARERK